MHEAMPSRPESWWNVLSPTRCPLLRRRSRFRNAPQRVGVNAFHLLIFSVLLVVGRVHAATELDIPIFTGGFGIGFYEESARLFEAQRPGVKVKIYGDPRITDKLRVRMIDGDLPDAALPSNLLIPELARAGRILDLTPLLNLVSGR